MYCTLSFSSYFPPSYYKSKFSATRCTRYSRTNSLQPRHSKASAVARGETRNEKKLSAKIETLLLERSSSKLAESDRKLLSSRDIFAGTERRSREVSSSLSFAAITLFPVVAAWPSASDRIKVKDSLYRELRLGFQRAKISLVRATVGRSVSRLVGANGLRSQPKCSSRLNMIALGCRSDEPCRARRESNIDRRSSGLTSSQEGASAGKGGEFARGWRALEGASARGGGGGGRGGTAR